MKRIGMKIINTYKLRVAPIYILLFISLVSLPAILHSQKINSFNYTGQKKVICGNGAVVSAHPLASKCGINILKQGGNAVDARWPRAHAWQAGCVSAEFECVERRREEGRIDPHRCRWIRRAAARSA